MGRTIVVKIGMCILLCLGPALSQEHRHQKMDDAFRELSDSTLTLRFLDALTGKGVAEATVEIEELGSFTTDGEGRVLFSTDETDRAYLVLFSRPGYISAQFTIKVMVGSLFFNRFSVSPVMDLRHLRIVLDWDDRPGDLDAHCVKEGEYHISYRDMKTSSDRVARLDRDDRNGNGPETITITEVDRNAEYSYYVHNYSDRGRHKSMTLSQSKACVKLYGEGRLLHVVTVPEDVSGTMWKVLRISGGQVQMINQVEP